MNQTVAVCFGALLLLNPISVGQDLVTKLIEKSQVETPLRLTLVKHWNNPEKKTIEVNVVELTTNKTGSIKSYNADHADRPQFVTFSQDVLTRFNMAVLDADGHLKPQDQKIVPTATIRRSMGIWDLPSSEAFQLDIFRFVEPGSIESTEPGKFKARSSDGLAVSINFDEEKCLIRELRLVGPDREEVRRYFSETNFGGLWLYTQQTIDVRLGDKKIQHRIEMKGEVITAPSLVVGDLYPPIGTLVTDERFSPSLTYRAAKRSYSSQELAEMWNSQVKAGGAYPSPPTRRTLTNPLKVIGLVAILGIPLILLIVRSYRKWKNE